MAVTQAIANSFKLEVLQEEHDFDADTFKLALYDRTTATLSSATTAYTATGESSGTGYTAGGNTLAVTATYPKVTAGVAEVAFDDSSWTGASFTAGAGLIYNSSNGNKAVVVLDFGSNATVVNGTLTVELPATAEGLVKLT